MRILLTTALFLAASSAFARQDYLKMYCELNTLGGDQIKIESLYPMHTMPGTAEDHKVFTYPAPPIKWSSSAINFSSQREDIYTGELGFGVESQYLYGILRYRDFQRTYYVQLQSINESNFEYAGKTYFKVYVFQQVNFNGEYKTTIDNEVATCYLN